MVQVLLGMIMYSSFVLVLLDMTWYSLVWFRTPWFGLVRYSLVWFGTPWFGLVHLGLVWYTLVWFGTHPLLGYNSLDTDGGVFIHVQVIDVDPAQIKF
jgi:hypothetical protein